jgi:LuxR family maltose regulon positive regulatory protein
MTQEAAIEYALSKKEPASSPESEATSSRVWEDILARSEQEVAVLLSRGLTNRQVAKELVSSERTVDPHEFEHITLVRLLIAQGEHREALGLLERLLEAAEAGGRGGSVIEILVLKALALQAQNDTPNALAALQRALSLAEPEGYVRTFVDEGAPMATLLKQLLKTYKTQQPSAAEPEVSLEYVRKLLEALGEEVMVVTKVPHARGKAGLLVEPITERELEVLRLLASDFSNREIAKKLYVSLDTVKSHLKHIYGKLGARSRYQAVDRARELDLLQ